MKKPLKRDNPKKAVGAAKASVANVSPIALLLEGGAADVGADVYGPFNWRETGVDCSTYYKAMMRHLIAWWCGQDIDPKSGKPHLSHLRAGAGLVQDADFFGVLTDDRPKLNEEQMKRLMEILECRG